MYDIFDCFINTSVKRQLTPIRVFWYKWPVKQIDQIVSILQFSWYLHFKTSSNIRFFLRAPKSDMPHKHINWAIPRLEKRERPYTHGNFSFNWPIFPTACIQYFSLDSVVCATLKYNTRTAVYCLFFELQTCIVTDSWLNM